MEDFDSPGKRDGTKKDRRWTTRKMNTKLPLAVMMREARELFSGALFIAYCWGRALLLLIQVRTAKRMWPRNPANRKISIARIRGSVDMNSEYSSKAIPSSF